MHEFKLLLDKILDCEFIHAMIYHIVAKHVECSFVIVVGSNHTVSVQRDIVT